MEDSCCAAGGSESPIKITLVGDAFVGKTTLGICYRTGSFEENPEPTVMYDMMNVNVKVKGIPVPIPTQVWDVGGSECYWNIRHRAYPKTDCIIICFSIGNPYSLRNVEETWIPELRWFCDPTPPIVLVGTKRDLRGTAAAAPGGRVVDQVVSKEEALRLKSKIKAVAYLEVSSVSVDQENVARVFETAVGAVLKARRRVIKQAEQHGQCTIT